jgi:hypothetical protein
MSKKSTNLVVYTHYFGWSVEASNKVKVSFFLTSKNGAIRYKLSDQQNWHPNWKGQ